MSDPVSSEEESSGNPLSPREQLECQKIQLEIAQLNRPFWRHGGFWSTAGGISIPLIGAIIAWSSGWFDLKQQEIKNANILLEAQNQRLASQKEALTSETSKLEASRIALNVDLERLNQRRTEGEHSVVLLTNELSQLQRQRDEKQQMIATLTAQLSESTKQNEQMRPIVEKVGALAIMGTLAPTPAPAARTPGGWVPAVSRLSRLEEPPAQRAGWNRCRVGPPTLPGPRRQPPD